MARRLVVLLSAAAALAVGAPCAASASSSWLLAQKDERMAADLAVAINDVRAAHGLRPLSLSPPLARAAAQHTHEMGRVGYFSHNSANGTSFSARIKRFYGPNGFRYWTAGENLLWSTRDLSAPEMVDGWMHSPPHRANLLKPGWRQFGISAERFASAPGYFGHRAIWLVTLDFGTRY